MPGLQGMFPVRSRCWLCGRFVKVCQDYGMRRCDFCDVRWTERWPGTFVREYVDYAGQSLMLGARWHFAPSEEYADLFDRVIDHSQDNIGCPA